MITISGTAYTLCGHCLNWFAVEQLGWDNELLTWGGPIATQNPQEDDPEEIPPWLSFVGPHRVPA